MSSKHKQKMHLSNALILLFTDNIFQDTNPENTDITKPYIYCVFLYILHVNPVDTPVFFQLPQSPSVVYNATILSRL